MTAWAVELQDIGKIYRVGKLAVFALREVSLRIAPGEFVAIAGPSAQAKPPC